VLAQAIVMACTRLGRDIENTIHACSMYTYDREGADASNDGSVCV
jgi:hypothetical protein